MDEAEVWAALERGGAVQRGHFAEVEGHAELRLGKYNGLRDPSGAERLAAALAERLADSGATLVVVWEDVEDIVLGYVVGRRLGVPVLRTFNADGLVGQAGPLPRGASAVLVTDNLRDPLAPRAVRALLERANGSLLGVAALVDSGLGDEPLLASLASLRKHIVAVADCPSCRQGEPLAEAGVRG
jgi:adenine/guanine phosphoribosyltransferase-like PRPP-binding protein